MALVERVLYNGNIFTLDIFKPRVTALALNGGRIVAYGADSEILALAGAGTIRDDLDGKTVIPGLVDAHIHWQRTAESLQQVNLFEVPSKREALNRIAERAGRTPPGEWIVGYGWAQDLWENRAYPTAVDLDTVAPQHPVYLMAKSVHAAWVNTAALRRAGITASTPDPDSGHIARDKSGKPTGILFEAPAMTMVARIIPPPSVERLVDLMETAQTQALASGLTGIHDFDNQDCLRALQVLRERDALALRVVKHINKDWLSPALELGLRWGFGDEWIRIGGLKLFADGALGPRTASMIEPYDGEPDNYGIIVTDKEEMRDLVSRASAAGLPTAVHAIGDRAVHDVLDVFESVRQEETARGEARHTRRHRIEHVQLIHPDDVDRLAKLDIIASMQPIHATSDYQMADRYWGARAQWGYNPRLQVDRGVVVAFGSDSPVESFDPFKGIHAAVTRRRSDGSPGVDGWYPKARLTREEALRGFTLGPAYAAGLEKQVGKLAAGYCADLVVLDRDFYAVSPDELLTLKVLATMVGGIWRFGGI